MNRRRLTGALAIGTTASLALFAGSAFATSSSIALGCDKATFSYRTFGPPPQSLATYDIALDGIPFLSGTLTPSGPLSVFDVPLGLQGHHVITAVTHGTPVNAFSSASATVDCPVPAPVVTPATPSALTPVAVEPLPRLVAPRKVTTPQKPRCALPKGAGVLWYVKRGCAIPRRFLAKPRDWAVTGELEPTTGTRPASTTGSDGALGSPQGTPGQLSARLRLPLPPSALRKFISAKAQGPSPASIVAGLLSSVPVLAGDQAFASSIQQGAGGRSSSGGVTSREMGRLIPLPVPGHPWTSVTRGPKRTVATSVSWISGRLRVSVIYAARAGRSDVSVAARPR